MIDAHANFTDMCIQIFAVFNDHCKINSQITNVAC